MSTLKDNNENTKNLWCRDARVNNIIKILGRNPFKQGKGYHIRDCFNHTNCRGAHTKEEIRVLPHLSKWDRMDKTKFNFPEIYFEILTVINNEKSEMKSFPSENIKKLNELNFIEIIQLWRELACYYRKISKEIPRKKDWKSSAPPQSHSSGYIYSDDVPCFYLSDKSEDCVWAFERLTKHCEKQLQFIDNINERIYITIWDICLGEKNCKEGVHHIEEALCNDDFLTGKCDCISEIDHETKIDDIKTIINDVTNQLAAPQIRPKRKEQLQGILNNKKQTLNNTQRKIHYTEQGMKPFIIQLELYIKSKIEEEKNKQIELDKKLKPTWDHEFAKQPDSPIGKVKKISLKTP